MLLGHAWDACLQLHVPSCLARAVLSAAAADAGAGHCEMKHMGHKPVCRGMWLQCGYCCWLECEAAVRGQAGHGVPSGESSALWDRAWVPQTAGVHAWSARMTLCLWDAEVVQLMGGCTLSIRSLASTWDGCRVLSACLHHPPTLLLVLLRLGALAVGRGALGLAQLLQALLELRVSVWGGVPRASE